MTFNIYEKKVKNLKVDEYEKIFDSMGEAPFWFTMSGGEPFLRKDIVDICKIAYEHCKPSILNIPTNGILNEIIPERVEQIVRNSPESEIIINLSLDEIGVSLTEVILFFSSFGAFNLFIQKYSQLVAKK